MMKRFVETYRGLNIYLEGNVERSRLSLWWAVYTGGMDCRFDLALWSLSEVKKFIDNYLFDSGVVKEKGES